MGVGDGERLFCLPSGVEPGSVTWQASILISHFSCPNRDRPVLGEILRPSSSLIKHFQSFKILVNNSLILLGVIITI